MSNQGIRRSAGLWLGMACLSAAYADSKGHQWIIWFAVALVFGPAAVIILWLLDSKSPELRRFRQYGMQRWRGRF